MRSAFLLIATVSLVSLGCSKGSSQPEDAKLRAEAARYLVQDVGHIPASYGYYAGSSGFNLREMPEDDFPVPSTQDPEVEVDEGDVWPTLDDSTIQSGLSQIVQAPDDIPVVESDDEEVFGFGWETTLASAKRAARLEGKPVIAIFRTPGCRACIKLKRDCKAEIENLYLGDFILCTTSTDVPPGRKFYPTTAVYRSSGRLVGTPIKGYSKQKEFLEELKRLTGRAR